MNRARICPSHVFWQFSLDVLPAIKLCEPVWRFVDWRGFKNQGDLAFYWHCLLCLCSYSRVLMPNAGRCSATWVCWRRGLPLSSKFAPASGPRPLLRFVGGERSMPSNFKQDTRCTWTRVSSRWRRHIRRKGSAPKIRLHFVVSGFGRK